MPATLSASAKHEIQSHLDAATTSTGVPGLVFCAVDKSGNYLTQQTAGKRGLSGSVAQEPMTNDSVFWIASCTKMITAIAVMQLAEQGKINLDSADQLYGVCPELKMKKVLQADGKTLLDRKEDITMRKLLSHTAGFGYSFFNEQLRDYGRPTGWDEFTGDSKDYLEMPLVNEPGSRWEYGINIDWAGIAVERISNMTLDAYFKKHIFEPLGVKDISFFPSKHMRDNQVGCQSVQDGKSMEIDHPFRRSIWHAEDGQDKIFCAGGAGCFAKPSEYCKIIATLLNDGSSPITGNRILKEATVTELLENQIKEFPDFGRQRVPAAKPHWTNELPEFYPQEGNPPQGWSLAAAITIEAGQTGRGKNTAWWAGITNLFWWCDREKGVGGMIASQRLPFGDSHVLGAWFGCEKALYDGLENKV